MPWCSWNYQNFIKVINVCYQLERKVKWPSPFYGYLVAKTKQWNYQRQNHKNWQKYYRILYIFLVFFWLKLSLDHKLNFLIFGYVFLRFKWNKRETFQNFNLNYILWYFWWYLYWIWKIKFQIKIKLIYFFDCPIF